MTTLNILFKIIYPGYLNRYYAGLIDTGATTTIMCENCLPEWKKLRYPIHIKGFNSEGSRIEKYNEDIKIQIFDKILKIPKVYCFNLENRDIILANDFLNQYRPITISFRYVEFTTPCDEKKLRAFIVKNQKRIHSDWIKGDERVTQEIKYEIINIVNDNREAVKKSLAHRLDDFYTDNPLTNWKKHKTICNIELINKDSIIQQKPFFNTEKDINEFKMHIDELIKMEFIQNSNSKHSSSAFIVNKHSEIKRGKSRMVIDYRILNAKTKTYNYPIPNKILKIKQIQGYKWFSKFDCKSGFHHIKLSEDSKELTAFSVPNGFYEWNVLPFGYKNAPGIFQSFMDKYFNQLENCVVYIDDILLFTKTEDEHIQLLKNFIEIVDKSGIVLSKKKTELFKNQIEFLGHDIDIAGIKMQSHIAIKLLEFTENIETRKQLQSFLGLINQLREFIPKLSKHLVPLQKKLKKDIQWSWTQDDIKLINKIKEMCKDLPKLEYPDENKKFTWIIETDASTSINAYGAVLKYKYEENKQEYICRYFSGTFKQNEEKWDINRKELMAVKNGILKFEPYICFNKFILRTDNSTVKSWLSQKLKNSIIRKEINRLITDIRMYDFTIELLKSTNNFYADKLSRSVERINCTS
ncbi:TPA_asm: replicase [Bacopa monnieri virus 3]|nr:TPA_asm: replicase [Bacopa monnieri virus 3]